MIRRLRRYLKTKGLELNVDKSKMMRMRKVGGRRKEETFTWEGVKIEKVRIECNAMMEMRHRSTH